jgi:voltage-gated potassium channel
MNVLRKSVGNRGMIYVVSLTLLVVFTSAAGIMHFENEVTGQFPSYSSAIWWTSMMITTMGSDYFPKSSEGRILGLLLAIYGFAIFGYVTAIVATFLMGKDKKEKNEIQLLRQEVQELKEILKKI